MTHQDRGAFPVRWIAIVLVLSLPVPSVCGEQRWGDIHGRILVDPDSQRQIGPGWPGSLCIDPKTNGLANVAVYLYPPKGERTPEHASYAKDSKNEVRLLTKGNAFEPRLLLVRTSQTVRHLNRDDELHAPNINLLKTPPSGVLVPANQTREWRFSGQEILPMPVQCNIHRTMRGFILVRDSPYMAKTDVMGRFVLRNVPVGDRRFRIWHERVGYLRNISFGEQRSDKGGTLTVQVREGKNSLTPAVLKAANFYTDKPIHIETTPAKSKTDQGK